jgi:hypothetical protein
MISAIFGIGGGIGLSLSGIVADNLGTRWLFWVNLISLPAALAAYRLIPPLPAGHRPRIDWLGTAVLSAALGAILLGVSEADEWGWGSPANVGLIGGGLLLVGVFLLVEARTAEPLIDLAVLRRPAVATTNLTGFMVGVAMFASFPPDPAARPDAEEHRLRFRRLGDVRRPCCCSRSRSHSSRPVPWRAVSGRASASVRCSRRAPR